MSGQTSTASGVSATETIQRAGDVRIERLTLVSSDNIVIDLNEFLIEFCIFEDLFSNHMTGYIHLSDSRNLIDSLNLHGEELVIIKFKTPLFDDATETISKTFRTTRITDRVVVRDNNTQTFVLHFASIELFNDMLLPLFVPFEGVISNVVEEIFKNYTETYRDYEVNELNKTTGVTQSISRLIILNETENKVKFVAPGWSPFKCYNWLASKAIPKPDEKLTAKNFLFWESNKSFYFGSIEKIFKDAYEEKNYIGRYTIAASNLKNDGGKDLNREYFLARDVEMIESVDQVRNYTNGYLANRLIYLDLFNKKQEIVDYDHVVEYFNQYHTSGPGKDAIPLFTNIGPLSKEQLAQKKSENGDLFGGIFRNPATSISFYSKQTGLYTGFSDNVNEKYSDIHGNRKSSLLELGGIKMNITVPGRTDVEVGRMLYLHYPGLGPKTPDERVMSSDSMDKLYSGWYLITAIRHKVNRHEHSMTMEIVKDSLLVDAESKELT